MRKKRFLSLALALAMILSLCPITAMATDEGDFVFSNGTITKYKGSGGRVEIPATIGGQPVTAIGGSAFNGNNDITEVVIPKGVTTIGIHAFEGCGKLKSVVIPEGVTTIGEHAFENCKALASVTIPKSVTTIGVEAFRDCINLESVVIPKGVTTIGEQAFDNCSNLESVVIPESVTTIGKNAFRGNPLESVTFMGQPTTIGDNAFYGVGGDLILPADWKGDPEEGDGVKWKGGRFNVVKHSHAYTGDYVIGTGENAGKHGQKCECGEVGNWTAHSFTDGVCVCGAVEAYAIKYNCVDQAGDPVFMSSTGPTTYYTKDGIVFDESDFVPEGAFYKFVSIEPESIAVGTKGDKDVTVTFEYAPELPTVSWSAPVNATVVAFDAEGLVFESGNKVPVGSEVTFTVEPAEGYEYAEAPKGWTLNEEYGTISGTVTVPDYDITVTIPEPTEKQAPVTVAVEVDGCRVMALPYDTGYYPISNLTVDGNVEMGTVGAGGDGFIAYTADGSSVQAIYLIDECVGFPDGWYDADSWEPIVDCNLAAYDYFMLYNGNEPITFTFTNPDNVPLLGSEPYDFPLEVAEGNTLYTYHSEKWQPIEAVFALSGSIEKPVRASVFWFDHAGHIDIDSCYSGEIRQEKDGSLVFAEGLLGQYLPTDTAIFVHIHDWDCTAEGHSCKNHDAENPTALSSDPMVVCPVMVLRNFTGKHTFGDDDICTVCGYEYTEPTYAVTWDEATNATVTASVGGKTITSGEAFVSGTEVAFTVTPKEDYEYAEAPKGWTLNEEYGTISGTVKVPDCDITVTIPEPTEKQEESALIVRDQEAIFEGSELDDEKQNEIVNELTEGYEHCDNDAKEQGLALVTELKKVEAKDGAVSSITYDVTPKDEQGKEVHEPEQPITFELPAPEGEEDGYVKVEHEDEEYYAKTTKKDGWLVRVVKTVLSYFSEVKLTVAEAEFKPVAQIGEDDDTARYFATLEDAVKNARPGDTITVLESCDGNGILIDKPLTIDFDNHTYTISGEAIGGTETSMNQGFHIQYPKDKEKEYAEMGGVTLKNGTLTVPQSNMADGKQYPVTRMLQNYVDLTMENMKIYDTNVQWREYGVHSESDLAADTLVECDGGNSTFKNCTIEVAEANQNERYALAIDDWQDMSPNGTQVTLVGCTIKGTIRLYEEGEPEELKSELIFDNYDPRFPVGTIVDDTKKDRDAADKVDVVINPKEGVKEKYVTLRTTDEQGKTVVRIMKDETTCEASLTLSENINMNFYVYFPKTMSEGQRKKFEVRSTFLDNTEKVELVRFSTKDKDGMEAYRAVVAEAYSYQMHKPVTVDLFYGDSVIKTFEYSVRWYLETACELFKDNEKLVSLMKACCSYGGEAQRYFSGKTYEGGRYPEFEPEDMADRTYKYDLSSVVKPEYRLSLTAAIEGLAYNASMKLGNEVSLNVYLGKSADGVTVSKITREDKTGGVTLDAPVVQKRSDGQYYFEVKGVRLIDLCKSYTMTITKGDKTDVLVFSPYDYLNIMWGDKALGKLCKAMKALGDSSAAYFN